MGKGRAVGNRRHMDVNALLDAVRIEEGAGEIDDGFAAPGHDEAAAVRDVGDVAALEVLLVGLVDEIADFRRMHADGHAFLGFGNREFGAVQAIVFLGNGVEVDLQRRRDFANGHGDAARSEIVADLDFSREFGVAEEALDLALGGGIAFLDLGGVFQCCVGVFLRRTGGPADAVAAGAAPDEQDDISGSGRAAEDVGARDGGDDRTDFEALGDVAGVIDFRDLAGREADLVTVGRVAAGSGLADFLLRQLARQRFGKRRARIAGAGDSHGLIDVGTPGQRIADAAAQTGCSAAEGLDFGRVVVGFVLEHHEPLFFGAAVD